MPCSVVVATLSFILLLLFYVSQKYNINGRLRCWLPVLLLLLLVLVLMLVLVFLLSVQGSRAPPNGVAASGLLRPV